MVTKIILKEELNTDELRKLELLFRETDRVILDELLILTDSPELACICRKIDIAVAAVLPEDRGTGGVSGGESTAGFAGAGEEAVGDSGIRGDWGFPGISYAVTDIDNLDETYLERIWQRYRGIPWKICETQRCLLRESIPEDVESFYRIYRDKSITAYMEDLFAEPEKEREYIREYIEKVYNFYGFGMWSVCLKNTGEVIGRAGLSMREGFEEPELGYVIGKKWQRQGIAAEVCLAILAYGREELGLERVRALMHPENVASERLSRKLGFSCRGEVEIEGRVYKYYSISLK